MQLASSQEKSTAAHEEDRAEISTMGTHAVPDGVTDSGIGVPLSAAARNEDSVASESTVDMAPENAPLHHPSPSTIPQNHSSTPLGVTTVGEMATTDKPEDIDNFGNKHSSTSKSSSRNALFSFWEASTVSKDTTLNSPKNANSFGDEAKKEYLTDTSPDGHPVSTAEETITALGNRITSTITTTTIAGDAFYKASRNMAADEGSKFSLSGKATAVFPSESIGKTVIPGEKATSDFENSTLAPSSIHSLENASAPGYVAITGSGDNAVREDTSATPPGNVILSNHSQFDLVGSNNISTEILNTTLKKTSGDITAIANIDEIVFADYESTIEVISTTSDKNTTLGHNTTVDGSGNKAVSGNDIGTTYREINQSLFDGGTATSASRGTFAITQDSILNVPEYFMITTASKVELGRSSEIIPAETTIAFDTVTSNVLHTIPTIIAVTEAAKEAPTRNAAIIFENGNSAALGEPAPQNTGGTTMEDIVARTTYKDATRSIESPEICTINSEKDVTTSVTTSAFENTIINSLTPRETTLSTGEDEKNIASGNGTISATEEHFTAISTEAAVGERSTTNFMSGDTTDSNISISTNLSEIVTSSNYARNTRTSAYGVTANTVTTTLGKMSTNKGSHMPTGSATSAVTMRIQAGTSHGRNTLLNEIMTAELSPSLSDDVIPGSFTFARETAVLESTTTQEDSLAESVSPYIAFTHDTVLDANLTASTTAGDSKIPSGIITVVPGAATPTNGPASNVSLLLREVNTDAVAEVTTNTTSSVFINITNSGAICNDTSEELYCAEGISAVQSGGSSILGQIPTLNHSFSVGTGSQEATTSPGGITTAFDCTTSVPDGAALEETFASLHSEIPVTLKQDSNQSNTTSNECTTAEAAVLTERPLTENTPSPSGECSTWSGAPMAIGNKNVASYGDTAPLCSSATTESNATSGTLMISEATPASEDASGINNTRGIHSFAVADTIISAASVSPNVSPTNKPRESVAANALEDTPQTFSLLEDTFTITSTATTAISTVTALTDTDTGTQAFPGDVTTVSRDKYASTLQDLPNLGKRVTSENILTTSFEDMRTHSEAPAFGTRTSSETHILEDTSDPVANIPEENLSHYSSDYYKTTITTTTPAASSTINTLSDTSSIPHNAASVFETATRSGEVLTSRSNSTVTCVANSIQDQTTISESPAIVPGNFFLATEENCTSITPSEAQDYTMANIPDGTVTSDITFSSISENITNITNPCVGPGDLNAAVNVPLNTITLALVLGETVPPGQTFGSSISVIAASGNSANSQFVEETDLSIESGDPIVPRTSTSADFSKINNITIVHAVPSGRSTNESRQPFDAKTSEDAPTVHEATDDSINGLPNPESIITVNMTPGNSPVATLRGNTADISAVRGTEMTTALGDIHSPAVTACGDGINTLKDNASQEKRVILQKASTCIHEDISSTMYEASTPNHTRPCEKTATFESTHMPVANLANRGTFGSEFSKATINEDTAEIANTRNDILMTHSENWVSAPVGIVSVSEDLCAPEGTVTFAQITTAILEEAGEQNELSTFGVAVSVAETPNREVDFMSEVNIREAASSTPGPTAVKEDILLAPVGDETAICHSEMKSLEKSKDLSFSTIPSEDSFLGTFTYSREMNHTVSSVTSGSYSEGCLEEASTIGTILGIAQAPSPLEEFPAPGATSASEDTNIRTTTIDISNSPMFSANRHGKYSTSEATTMLGGVTLSGIMTSPRPTFVHETISFQEASISTSAIGSTSEVTIDPTETSTHGATFSIAQISTSGNVSSIKITEAEGITSTITCISSTSSSGNFIFTPCSNSKTDTSGDVTTMGIHSETSYPGASILPQETLIFADGAANHAFGHLSSPKNIVCAPENAISEVLEDTTTVFGSSSTVPDDAVTICGMPNDNSTTVEGTLIGNTAKQPSAKSKETAVTENTASSPEEIKFVLGGASIIAPEETNAALSGKEADSSTDAPMSTDQVTATSSGKSSAATLGETNIATFAKTMAPRLPISPDEPVAITPEGKLAAASSVTTGNTKDALECTWSAPEESLSDAPREDALVAQPGNTTEAPTAALPAAVYETVTITHRGISATIPRKSHTLPMPEAHPEVFPTASSVEAITSHKQVVPARHKENTCKEPTSEKMSMATPMGIISAFQGKNTAIKSGSLLPYWSVVLIGIVVTLVLAAALGMVIYSFMFFIVACFATS
ncbi:flocculation protein FLO11-like [Varanus komodoensis]|uniref:flocculation protein FLO11-like n=1 Tax=Varanus komodoensis TaxID=61221 RepID=UPI001CF77F47|nr:flocculation protein FLO11-like [Varanus komodoensis]